MQPTARTTGGKLVSGLVRFLMTLVVIALLGLVGYLAAERNARTFSFLADEGQLVVMKGRMLPLGEEPWQPQDAVQAEAYAPIPLEGHTPSQTFLERDFQDRDELDRALFGLLEQLARPRITSDDPRQQERGVYYLRRAALLTGLTGSQRETLTQMQAEVAWYQARLKLEQARQLVEDAMDQLELATRSRDANAGRARQMAQGLTGPVRQFDQALKSVLGGSGAQTVPPPARLDAEQPPRSDTREAPASPDQTPRPDTAPEEAPPAPKAESGVEPPALVAPLQAPSLKQPAGDAGMAQ